MPKFIYNNTSIEVDEKGYLIDGQQWNREVAKALAQELGMPEMSEKHWLVVDFLRQFQTDNGAAPMIRVLCKGTRLSLKEIYDLFPAGPSKGACLVAGLPRPDSCV